MTDDKPFVNINLNSSARMHS